MVLGNPMDGENYPGPTCRLCKVSFVKHRKRQRICPECRGMNPAAFTRKYGMSKDDMLRSLYEPREDKHD